MVVAKAAKSATIPELTSEPVLIGFTTSPCWNDSLKLKADPAVFMSYVPSVIVAAAVTLVGAVRPPKTLPFTAEIFMLDPETGRLT